MGSKPVTQRASVHHGFDDLRRANLRNKSFRVHGPLKTCLYADLAAREALPLEPSPELEALGLQTWIPNLVCGDCTGSEVSRGGGYKRGLSLGLAIRPTLDCA